MTNILLVCTSTLAIGVNLPAHLVIIKSTEYYVNQKFVEYSMTQILQMIGNKNLSNLNIVLHNIIIGRAGRPQVFDLKLVFQIHNFRLFSLILVQLL